MSHYNDYTLDEWVIMSEDISRVMQHLEIECLLPDYYYKLGFYDRMSVAIRECYEPDFGDIFAEASEYKAWNLPKGIEMVLAYVTDDIIVREVSDRDTDLLADHWAPHHHKPNCPNCPFFKNN